MVLLLGTGEDGGENDKQGEGRVYYENQIQNIKKQVLEFGGGTL